MNTSDPQDELFPIVDENDKVIGKMTRKIAHQSPNLIHRAVAIFVQNRRGNLLIQKRSKTKDTSPECWMYSVGGHVGYGEEYVSTAAKEIKEELGVSVPQEDLVFIGKTLISSAVEKEIIEVYRCVVEDNIAFKPTMEKVSEVVFVDKEKLKKMLKEENWTPAAIQIIP
mgnify:CR=1 FL=1